MINILASLGASQHHRSDLPRILSFLQKTMPIGQHPLYENNSVLNKSMLNDSFFNSMLNNSMVNDSMLIAYMLNSSILNSILNDLVLNSMVNHDQLNLRPCFLPWVSKNRRYRILKGIDRLSEYFFYYWT